MAQEPLRAVPNGVPASTSTLPVVHDIAIDPTTRIQRHQEEKYLPGGWIVQKFGGTSVGKFARNIAEDIVSHAIGESRIAVVCSARSSSTKSEGTTNRLLRAAREAEKPHSKAYIATVDAIRHDHIAAAKDTVRSPALVQKLVADIHAQCDNLVTILESAQHLEEVSTRAEDKIVSKGEKLSCLSMTAVLRDIGINAVYVDLADVIRPPSASGGSGSPGSSVTATDGSRGLDLGFYLNVSEALASEVVAATTPGAGPSSLAGPPVPVLTGYFGPIPSPGLLTSIGRGYTDLCAALISVGLHARELQVWKEVDGIFTADPRKVPTARLLPSVTPAEAAELTFYGSEVIHPFTMEQVIRARIPIRIKNVVNPRGEGTVIIPDRESVSELNFAKSQPDAASRESHSHGGGVDGAPIAPPPSRQRPKRPTAVTVKNSIVILNVHSNKRTRAHGFLMNIFRVLDRFHLSVDLISSSEVHVSMALHSETSAPLTSSPADGGADFAIQSEDLTAAVHALKQYGTVDLAPRMSIISLVGRQLRNMVGISGRFLSVLGENGINIEMISQGASEINISCVVAERESVRALSVVHTALFMFLDD